MFFLFIGRTHSSAELIILLTLDVIRVNVNEHCACHLGVAVMLKVAIQIYCDSTASEEGAGWRIMPSERLAAVM